MSVIVCHLTIPITDNSPIYSDVSPSQPERSWHFASFEQTRRSVGHETGLQAGLDSQHE
jgi:hypothetical protein